VVISQIYGGAGCGSAGCSTYKNDYIEIFNAGSATVSLNGWSVQYASATGTSSWTATPLGSVSIASGKYLLIAEGAGSNGVNDIPTADVTGSTAMSATGGKVALVNATTALSGACPTGSSIQDEVGYGSTANCSETSPAPAPSTTNAIFRAGGGCTDSDNNSSDFSAAAANPRNSSSDANTCATGPTNPTGVGSANPSIVQAGDATILTVIVTPGTDPTSDNLYVEANLTSIGGPELVEFDDDGLNPDGTENFSYNATVTVDQTPGPRAIPLTVGDEMDRVSNPSIVLNVIGPPMTIMTLQGHGAVSPYNGQIVQTMTTSIVTVTKSNGFFMQDANGDGDLTTSDGIFVYTASAPTVHSGDAVSVIGTVQEFNGSTEIANVYKITTASSGSTLPPAFVLDDHPPTTDPRTGICTGGASTLSNPPSRSEGYQASNFACLDGMLVAMNDAIVTGATYGNGSTDGVHTGTPTGVYATLATQPRPFRGPGELYPGVIGHENDLPVWNGEPEIIDLYYPGLNFDGTDFVYNAGTRFSVTGIVQGFISFGTQTYELYPITGQMVTNTALQPPTYPQPVADSAAGTLTVGSQNFLHFFNDVADGMDTSGYNDTCAGTGASDECPTPTEYQQRLAKWTKQICEVLKSPVAVDAEEIENRSVLSDLAGSVQTACGTSYVPYALPGNDISGINIGILVRSDVSVTSVTQLFHDTQTTNCSSGTSCGLNDRPPVLMRASWNGYNFALLAIYDRSLSAIDDVDSNGQYSKPYIGRKRAEEAAQVARIVQAWQSGNTLTGAGSQRQDASGTITQGPFDMVGEANVPLIVAGDFNAYEFTDAFADVTGMIKGTAVQSQNLYWFTGNAQDPDAYVAPSPTLVDTGMAANQAEKYSFNFSGYAQEIDHVLLSRTAWKDFVSVSNAHGNSDVSEASPIILDPTTAARSGDHDGQVITIAIDRIFANGFEAQP
jgi:hypothetical protein